MDNITHISGKIGKIIATPLVFFFVWVAVRIAHLSPSFIVGAIGAAISFSFACLLCLWMFRRDLLNTIGYIIFSPVAALSITISFLRLSEHLYETQLSLLSIASDLASMFIAGLILKQAWIVMHSFFIKVVRASYYVVKPESLAHIKQVFRERNNYLPLFPVHAKIIHDKLTRQFNIHCYVQEGLHFMAGTNSQKTVDNLISSLTNFSLECVENHLIIHCQHKLLVIPEIPSLLIFHIKKKGKIVVEFSITQEFLEENFIELTH